MSDYMKEMERLVDAHEIAISRRLNGAAWNEETDASRAALLAHSAQRDHIEGSLGMVPPMEHERELCARAMVQPAAPDIAEVRPGMEGWKEAAIAWEVCASIHREYAKKKDPFFTTRQSDFVKHAEATRAKALTPEPDMAERDALIADNERLMQIAAQEVSAAEVPMPQGYAERPSDYTGGIWIESQMRQYGDAREAAGYARGLKEADKLLLEAPRWRDVADELPQEAQEVLFVRSGKTVHGAWIGGIFWHNNQKMAAAYWMPLPNPLSAALSGEVTP